VGSRSFFGRPRPQPYDFKRDRSIETFLVGAINHALPAPANFFQQFVIAKISKHFCWSRGFLSIQNRHAAIAVGVSDGYSFILGQIKAGL
jgi:hypothetical protein